MKTVKLKHVAGIFRIVVTVHFSVGTVHFVRFVIQIKKCTNYILKVKSVPLQAWSGPEGSRKLRFPG